MISVLIDYKLDRYRREIQYAFDFIFHTLGLGHRFISSPENLRQYDILLLYGNADLSIDDLQALSRQYITIDMPADNRLYNTSGYAADQLRRIIREVKLLSPTPIIAEKKFDYPAENYLDDDIHACKLNFDLAGNVFYHLANREEAADIHRDEEGCFPDSASAFYHWKDVPYVDNMLWLLDNLIKDQTRRAGRYIVQKHYWPKAQDMAIALTHSVDDLQKWDANSIFAAILDDFGMLVTLRWQTLFRNVWSKLKYVFTNFEMYWNFDEFMQLENEYKLKSTWFIAAESTPEIDYSLDDVDLQDEMRQILKSGYEIGLLTTSDKLNRDDFVTRKQVMLRQIQKDQLGIRQQNYLLNDKLKDLHQKLLPQYDSSSAFRENAGFKNGMIFPYKYWYNSLKSGHLELPVVFRDSFLRLGRYRTVSLEDAKQMLKKAYQTVRRSRGLFCLDFTVANYSDIPYCSKLYSYVLALFKAEKAWVATCTDIAGWWEKRSRIVVDESEWEFSIHFTEGMDSLALQIFGDVQIVSVEGAESRIDGNTVFLLHPEPNAVAVVRVTPHTAQTAAGK